MKKKGFTLVELLAVIVILAVIALIATPMIMDVIEKARRGTAIESVNGILEAAENYQLESMLEGEEIERTIDLTSNILTYKGSKPSSGTLVIGENNQMHVLAKIGKYCIEKDDNDESPKVVEDSVCEKGIEIVKAYGIKRTIETESSAWERTDDAVGLVANAQIGATEVRNDFDTIYPWSDIKSYNYNTDTKTITAWYGDDNFKFDGSNGEVLTYIPEFYYRRIQEDGYEYISITKDYQEGYTKSEAFSVGRYTMSGAVNDVHSRSGYQPLGNHTITEFREYAKQLGEEFGQMDYHYFILELLYLVEYADYNSQAKLGPGYTNNSNTAPTQSGGCDILGMHSGSVDGTDGSSVIYRGIEDIFGNIWQFIDGMNINNYQAYICYDKNQYEVDKYDGCYQRLGYVNANTYNKWISKLGYDSSNPLIALPLETNGNSNTYISDNYFSYDGSRVALVGGLWGDGLMCGLWSWDSLEASSYSSVYFGARLLKTS